MASIGEMVRRMDYQKRAMKTFGLRRGSGSSTQIQECSLFVRSANDHELDVLQTAVRRMEADEKSFRDVHKKQMTNMKRFHNSVHARSAGVDHLTLKSASVCVDDTFTTQKSSVSSDRDFPRRNSEPVTSQISHTSRRLSVQQETPKNGRSFRKLKDALASKSRIVPDSGSTKDKKLGKSKSCPLFAAIE